MKFKDKYFHVWNSDFLHTQLGWVQCYLKRIAGHSTNSPLAIWLLTTPIPKSSQAKYENITCKFCSCFSGLGVSQRCCFTAMRIFLHIVFLHRQRPHIMSCLLQISTNFACSTVTIPNGHVDHAATTLSRDMSIDIVCLHLYLLLKISQNMSSSIC